MARTRPLAWQAQARHAMRKLRQDIREAALITGVTGTGNQMTGLPAPAVNVLTRPC